MSKPLPAAVRRFHQRANDALCELASMTVPGSKLTLLMRNVEVTDGSRDIVITDDDIEAVITALLIRQQEAAAGTDRVIAAEPAAG